MPNHKTLQVFKHHKHMQAIHYAYGWCCSTFM